MIGHYVSGELQIQGFAPYRKTFLGSKVSKWHLKTFTYQRGTERIYYYNFSNVNALKKDLQTGVGRNVRVLLSLGKE